MYFQGLFIKHCFFYKIKNVLQFPTFKDLPKWNNRIFANLLYFQSNYFAFILVAIFMTTFFYAKAVAIGLVTLMMVGFLAASIFSSDPRLLSVSFFSKKTKIFLTVENFRSAKSILMLFFLQLLSFVTPSLLASPMS